MLVVSLYDRTGNAVRPWAEAGYDCLCFDIAHQEARHESVGALGGRIFYYHWDALKDPHPWIAFSAPIAFVMCFPPCTHLAGLRALSESIEMFAVAAEFAESTGAPYLIENPVSTISSYWRKPDYSFHPYEYTAYELGDNYTKKTCLWTGGGFVMPKPARSALSGPPDNRIHAAPPSDDRADFRSASPKGFFKAVFEANHKV
jgi:hypothetical protein